MSSPAPICLRVRRVEGPPLVAVRVALAGGAREEAVPGLALVTGRLLDEGSGRRDWRRIAEEAESLGMALYATAGWDALGLTIEALSTDWERALEWAAELALDARFPPDRLDHVVRQTRAELVSLSELGDVATGWAFASQLYGDHPRGRPLQGSAESLERLRPEQCLAHHAASLERGVVLAVAGRVDEEAVHTKFTDLLGAGRSGAELARPLRGPEIVAGEQRRLEVELPRGEQAHVFLGRITVPRGDAAVPALLVLAAALGSGAGLSGRIPYRLREVEGLAYSTEVATAGGAGHDPGRLEVYVGTSPLQAERAVDCVLEELARVAAEGIREAELESARTYLLGRLPFARETAGQWSALLADAAIYDLPLDREGWVEQRLRDVKAADVAQVAHRFLDPEGLRVTLGRPRS